MVVLVLTTAAPVSTPAIFVFFLSFTCIPGTPWYATQPPFGRFVQHVPPGWGAAHDKWLAQSAYDQGWFTAMQKKRAQKIMEVGRDWGCAGSGVGRARQVYRVAHDIAMLLVCLLWTSCGFGFVYFFGFDRLGTPGKQPPCFFLWKVFRLCGLRVYPCGVFVRVRYCCPRLRSIFFFYSEAFRSPSSLTLLELQSRFGDKPL